MNPKTNEIKTRMLFTVFRGSKYYEGREVESKSVSKEELQECVGKSVLSRTGKKLSEFDWKVFKANHKLVKYAGDVKYSFKFDQFSID